MSSAIEVRNDENTLTTPHVHQNNANQEEPDKIIEVAEPIPNNETKPKDSYNFVFLTFLLNGMGYLMPWNMFITAESYFVDYKLNVPDPVVQGYRDNFLITLGVAANIPNVMFSALNIFVQIGGNTLGVRIIGAILAEIVIFIFTIILAMVKSYSWAAVFYYITMVSVVVINTVNGIYQSSLYGIAAKLPMEYSMAIVLGNNISGTFTALINIISIAASPNLRTAAIYYFLTAVAVLLVCLDTFIALPLTKFYRHYDKLSKTILPTSQAKLHKLSYRQLLCKIWPQCFNVFMVFFVTLTVFPAILADVRLVDDNFPLSVKYFAPVTCFLFFNLSAMIGSFLPSFFKWPGPKNLWIAVLLRLLLIPYFMFCNYKPEQRKFAVLIKSDWAYSLMVLVLGLSSGHFSSLAMMYAPQYVNADNAPTASMVAAFFLVMGVFIGVNFTYFIKWLVET